MWDFNTICPSGNTIVEDLSPQRFKQRSHLIYSKQELRSHIREHNDYWKFKRILWVYRILKNTGSFEWYD